jgi:hypothetical protein
VPLPLEDLETTSIIPSRLDRGVHSGRNSTCDHAVGDPVLRSIGTIIPARLVATRVLGDHFAAFYLSAVRCKPGFDKASLRRSQARRDVPG